MPRAQIFDRPDETIESLCHANLQALAVGRQNYFAALALEQQRA